MKFDNAEAQLGHIAVFLFGFAMISVVLVAVLAQNSIRATTTAAYLTNDSFGGHTTAGLASAVNVSSAVSGPAVTAGIGLVFIIAALVVIAAIGVVAYIRSH